MLLSRSTVRSHARRSGVAVLVALCLTLMVGVLAFAVDGGMLMSQKRHAQAAADAAALAAATLLYTHYPDYQGKDSNGLAKDAALSNAASNGFGNDGSVSTVEVNIPPKSGNFVGQDGYVEVIVTYQQPRYFSKIWGKDAMPITARAVARGLWSTVNNGIMCLDLDDKGALNAHGNGSVVVDGAPVIVNSNHETSAAFANGNGSLTAPTFVITGGYTTTGTAAFNGTMVTGADPSADPLRYLPAPNPNSMPVGTETKVGNVYTLTPGRYPGGIKFSRDETVIMLPGIYYMDAGGFSFTSKGSLTALEVMIYNAPTTTSQGIKITGQGAVTITPPTSGVYQGISIFQDRTKDVTVKITGNGQCNISGTVYAANALVMVEGNGDVSMGSQYISRKLDLGGNGALNITWDPDTAPHQRIIGLVE